MDKKIGVNWDLPRNTAPCRLCYAIRGLWESYLPPLCMLILAFLSMLVFASWEVAHGKNWWYIAILVFTAIGIGSLIQIYRIYYSKELKSEYTTSRKLFRMLNLPRTLLALIDLSYPTFNWYSTIIEDKLVVGGVPLLNWNHPQELKKMGITHVISIIEEKELKQKLLFNPIKPEKSRFWKLIPSPDNEAISPAHLTETLEWIKNALNEKGKVYLHCKTGRGRSISAVLAFLVLYGASYSNEVKSIMEPIEHSTPREKAEAIYEKYMKKYRPEVNINTKQWDSVTAYLHARETRNLSQS